MSSNASFDKSLDPTRDAVISSTARDLPKHREKVAQACLAARYFPHMMEHLPASDQDAVTASHRLVDRADVYVGIFAGRYGHVPSGANRSITEMEFDRALERHLTVLAFIAEGSSVTPDMVEPSADAQQKLERLKARVCEGRVRALFTSVDDLARQVQGALSELRLQDVLHRLQLTMHALDQAESRAQRERADPMRLRERLSRMIALVRGKQPPPQ